MVGGGRYPEYYLVKAAKRAPKARPNSSTHPPICLCADCWEEKLLARQRKLERFEATDGLVAPDAMPVADEETADARQAAEAEIVGKLAEPGGGFQPAECELEPESTAALEREILRFVAIQTCPFLLGVL
jgi:hypothetical protein